MLQPKVIFLDAVGTLFGVRGSVGQVYAELAHEAGVQVEVAALNQAFVQSFQAAPEAVFPGVPAAEIVDYEFRWWQAIATQSFEQIGALHQFSDFPSFFTQLYAHFATDKPWFLYPDVPIALEYWHKRGIQLGVLSNFDQRLYRVLAALDLAQFFTSVTISTEVGSAKPDPQIFTAGLEKHQCAAAAAWHIGDSLVEDFQGAQQAGLQAVWLRRAGLNPPQSSRPLHRTTPDSVSTLQTLLPASPC